MKETAKVTRALEERIAHLTRTVEDLSQVVAAQEAEIATLKHRVERRTARAAAREAAESGAVVLGDAHPPHW